MSRVIFVLREQMLKYTSHLQLTVFKGTLLLEKEVELPLDHYQTETLHIRRVESDVASTAGAFLVFYHPCYSSGMGKISGSTA